MNRKFYKTIRFRLTLIYSLIFFIFTSLFIIAFNIYLQAQIPALDPDAEQRFPPRRQYLLEQLELEQLRSIREKEYQEAQKYTLKAVAPLVLLSFGLGYYLSGVFLKPIDDLRIEIDKIKVDQLGKKIPKEADDEIGHLIDSFNDMSRRLQYAFECQSQFVQDASHEIKTPLAIIQTSLDTVLESKNPEKEELKDAMRSALDGMKQLNDLTSSLLELTSPENSQKEKIDLIDLARSQVIKLQKYAKNSGITMIFSSKLKNHEMIASRYSLERAIFNLLENAIKYSEGVSAPTVELKIKKSSSGVNIAVIDNGSGIPKELRNKIFDRFYRVDKSRSRKKGGFGLGLAITKKIVEEHGGTISVDSERGRTEFTIWLPA